MDMCHMSLGVTLRGIDFTLVPRKSLATSKTLRGAGACGRISKGDNRTRKANG